MLNRINLFKNNLTMKPLDLLLLGIVFLYSGIMLVIFYKFQPDDTYIFMVYAKNFLQGNGLTFNGMYVEGFSSIIWVYVLSILGLFTDNLLFVSKCMSLFFTFGITYLIYMIMKDISNNRILAFLASLLYTSVPSIVIWTAGSLETQLYSFLIILVCYMVAYKSKVKKNHVYIGIIFSLIAATRPEGFALIGLMLSYHLYNFLINKSRETFLNIYACFVAGIGLILLWRYSFFGDVLPTTVYAKSGEILSQIPQGLNYFYGFIGFYKILFFVFIISLIWTLLFLSKKSNSIVWRNICFLNVVVLLGYLGFIVMTGGDWMLGYRFFVPVIPPIIMIIMNFIIHLTNKINNEALSKITYAVLIFLVLILNFKTYSFAGNIKKQYTSDLGDIYAGQYLADKVSDRDTVAVIDAGAIPYYVNSKIIDIIGLNNKYISKLKGPFMLKMDNQYVLDSKPQYIQMHTMKSKSGLIRPINVFATVNLFFSYDFQEKYNLDEQSPVPTLFKRHEANNKPNIMTDYYNAKVDFNMLKGNNINIKVTNMGTGVWFAENNNNGQGCVYYIYKVFNGTGNCVFESTWIPLENDLAPGQSQINQFELPQLAKGYHKIQVELIHNWIGTFNEKKHQSHIFLFTKGNLYNILPLKRLIFGDKEASFYLLEGFSDIETEKDHAWRWSDGPVSKINVPLKQNTAYKLILNVLPFNIPNNTQQIEVYLNNEYIGKISLRSNNYENYELILPKDKVRKLNEIAFKYAYAKSPKDIDPMSNDNRLLAVNYNYIAFDELNIKK